MNGEFIRTVLCVRIIEASLSRILRIPGSYSARSSHIDALMVGARGQLVWGAISRSDMITLLDPAALPGPFGSRVITGMRISIRHLEGVTLAFVEAVTLTSSNVT